MSQMTPLAAVLLPLFGAPLVALLGKRPNLREAATLLTGSGLFALVAALFPKVMAGARPQVQLLEIGPGLDLFLQVEPLGMGWCLDCRRNPGPHVRPEGVSPTDMAWTPTEESIAAANAKLSNGDILPPEHCGACHR